MSVAAVTVVTLDARLTSMETEATAIEGVHRTAECRGSCWEPVEK